MDCRKYILTLLLCVAALLASAQTGGYQSADSASLSLYVAGDWKQLVTTGQQMVADGTDFPALRQRMGFAYFILGNYTAAINEYEQVLKHDSYNQTARYYTYLSYKYLNNDLFAARQESYLDSAAYQHVKHGRFSLVSAALESSFKMPGNDNRGNAFYTRLGLSSRITNRLQLDQSVFYFNQAIYRGFGNFRVKHPDRQAEYFAGLNYAATNRLTLIGAYHYLNTHYQTTTYHSNVFLAGLSYSGIYYNIQGDINIGRIINEDITQYNTKLTLYPLGNLNLYFSERVAYLNGQNSNNFVFKQTAGYKVAKKVWLETSATFGELNNYIEADGLYIYNAVDNTKLKLTQTVYYQLINNAMLQLNYTYEKKKDVFRAVNYNQHSITAGILWKF